MTKIINEAKEVLAKLDYIGKVSSASNNNTPSKEQVFGLPNARKGEDIMSSRGFQYQKMYGLMTKVIQPEQAKIELEFADRLKAINNGHGYNMAQGAQYVAPLSTSFFSDNYCDSNFRNECKGLLAAGMDGVDPSEVGYLRNKGGAKSQSWVDDTTGGSLVPPPGYGDLIPLFRNKNALLNAGATLVPMPAQGSITYPRETSAPTAYRVGENQPITTGTVGTGRLTLRSKKIAALINYPNELVRYASPASEALFRESMMKSVSLLFDYDCLYGGGSDVAILGLIYTPGVATVTPTTVGSDGNTLSPADLMNFPSTVEENNGDFEGFILRPSLFWAFAKAQAAVYNGSSTVAKGPFLYDQYRSLAQGFNKEMIGYKATITNQVSVTQAKGNATNLTTLFGGQWSDYHIALFGSIEFAFATQGDTAFAYDQTSIRCIITGDAGAWHPGVFAIADQVLQTLGS